MLYAGPKLENGAGIDAFAAGGGAPNVSAWPVFIGEMGDGTGSVAQTVPGGEFRTVNVSSVVDSHGAFNATSRLWTVPTGEVGTYEITGKVRIGDYATPGISCGIGMHTSNTDHPAFFWDNTKNNRQGIQNTRLIQLTAGQQIRLFIYIDQGGDFGLSTAALTIQRIR